MTNRMPLKKKQGDGLRSKEFFCRSSARFVGNIDKESIMINVQKYCKNNEANQGDDDDD